MAVLPDDVGGLRAVLELKFLLQKLDVLVTLLIINHITESSRVVALECDEGSSGYGESLEVIEKFIDLDLAFTHSIEVIGRDLSTTSSESLDQGCVVEGEDDIGDLGASILRNFLSSNLLLLGLSIDFFDSPGVVSDPLVKLLLDLFLHVLLEGESWGNALLEGTARGFVDVCLPPVITTGLIVGLDWELDGVVTSCDGGHVPLKLLDLAALIHGLDADSEEEADKNTSGNSDGHLVVLGCQVLFRLNACVLEEEGGVISDAS